MLENNTTEKAAESEDEDHNRSIDGDKLPPYGSKIKKKVENMMLN